MLDSEIKLQQMLDKYPHIWKTKASLMSYLRGGLRRSCWMKHPVKLEFIKNNRERIPNPNPRGKVPEVWGGRCNVCKNLFVQSKLAVDHVREFSASLKDIEDIQTFVELISLVIEDDLQFVCKECHDTISYSHKHSCPFEEARVRKEHIEIGKDKRFKSELEARGMVVPKTIKEQSTVLLEAMLKEINSEEKV